MTQSLEDYLKVIGLLDYENHNPRVKDIAERLGHSKPSVHIALHELEDRGMIEHEHYGAITLTKLGQETYYKIITKHITIEKYLTDVLHVSAENADKDACAMEHTLSDETMDRIREVLESQPEK